MESLPGVFLSLSRASGFGKPLNPRPLQAEFCRSKAIRGRERLTSYNRISSLAPLSLRLPQREKGPCVVSARRRDAVAAVSRGRQRGPIAPTACHGRSVHREGARAGEIAAVTTSNHGRRLAAHRTRAQTSRRVATIDGDVGRVAANVAARPGAGAAYRDLDLVIGRQGTVAGRESQHVGSGRGETDGCRRGVGGTEGHGARAAGLAPGDGEVWWGGQAVVARSAGDGKCGWKSDAAIDSGVNNRCGVGRRYALVTSIASLACCTRSAGQRAAAPITRHAAGGAERATRGRRAGAA